MARSIRQTFPLLLPAAAIVLAANVRGASAGCAPVPTAGGDVIVCDAATPPEPSPAINFLGGNDSVTVNSGTYGAFTFPSGSNTLIFGPSGGAPVVNGTVAFTAGASMIEVHSGTITGAVTQSPGIDSFVMTGGQIQSLAQGDGKDTFFMSGGTIVGAFEDGDIATVTGGTIGRVDMKLDNNIFDMSGGTIQGNLVTGFGNDTITVSGGTIGGNISVSGGTDSVTITGGQVSGEVRMSTGNDTFVWDGGGTIGGTIDLNTDNDTAILRNLTSANLGSTPLFEGGTGTDSITFDNVEAAGIARFINWETMSLINGSRITFDGNLAMGDAGTGTGTVSVDTTSTIFAGNGVNPSILPFTSGQLVTVTNAGLIDLTNGGSGATDSLTVVGNYVGTGGRLALQSVLGADGSPSDKLVVSGTGATGSGSTSIGVTNLGGAGALTVVDGIQVVEAANGATTQAGAFSLAGPVAAGPFEYFLFKGGVTPGSVSNWYLRSTVVAGPTAAPGTPPLPPANSEPVPLFRPEVAVQAAVPGLARAAGLATLGTYHERMGVENPTPGWRAWGRLFGQHTDQHFGGTVRPDFDGSIAGFQVGTDLWKALWVDGHRDHAGLYAAYARTSGNVRGFALGFDNAPAGQVSLDATSVGAYWTHIGPLGWYLDTVLQATWLDGDPRSHRGIRADASGQTYAASIEGGYPIPVGFGLVLEPQAQAIWQHLSLDDTADRFSTIDFDTDDTWTSRVGARLGGRYPTPWALWLPYLKANVWWNSGASDTLLFAAFPIAAGDRSTSVELGGGLTAKLGPMVSLYGEASYLWSVDGPDIESIRGTAGLRVTW